ncbi:MAG: anthranilate synthase component I family protein [Defluviitaleaceae bacterium]|nr:anthranilate synthase component I family protein [Defluviitaleaceae bacterium]
MFKPTLQEAREISKNKNFMLLPVSTEMRSDMYTPMEIMRILKGISRHCFVLESAEDSKNFSRYTFLGFDPKMSVSCHDGMVQITDANANQTTEIADPIARIQKILDENKAVKIDGLPPFCGGLVGYFAYDYAKYSEPSLTFNSEDKCFFRDVDLMLFDKVIAFDHYTKKIILIVNIRREKLEQEFERAKLELDYLKKLIQNGTRIQPQTAQVNSEFSPLFTRNEYCAMVEKAKKFIDDGELQQIVLSNRYEADFEGSLFDMYRVLRGMNPSPYMFYFSGTDFEIAGASPETLVKLQDGKIYTFPLAGTRPRGKTVEEDIALEKELLADKKELSEHDMLVELGKEDLAKVAENVKVDRYMNILRFSHVMHIGSVVSGTICDGKTGLDAIGAVLPAGTLSGAPKLRSLEIIDKLEKNKRGIYGGAIGYLDFAGNMDTCIAIRIAYKKNGKVFVRAGAGIVAESIPESEYNECENKMKAVLLALKEASGGID